MSPIELRNLRSLIVIVVAGVALLVLRSGKDYEKDHKKLQDEIKQLEKEVAEKKKDIDDYNIESEKNHVNSEKKWENAQGLREALYKINEKLKDKRSDLWYLEKEHKE